MKKHCNACKTDRPESLFAKGNPTKCRDCVNAYQRDYLRKRRQVSSHPPFSLYTTYARLTDGEQLKVVMETPDSMTRLNVPFNNQAMATQEGKDAFAIAMLAMVEELLTRL